MRPRKAMSFISIIAAVLLLSIAYAVVADITLNITGNVLLTAGQAAEFRVAFSGSPTYTGDGKADLKITSDTTATMDVTGLEMVGDSLTAYFDITNYSEDITAYIEVNATNNYSQYFTIERGFRREGDSGTLAPGQTEQVYVTATMKAFPTDADLDATFKVWIDATTEENTGEGNTITGGNIIVGECAHQYTMSKPTCVIIDATQHALMELVCEECGVFKGYAGYENHWYDLDTTCVYCGFDIIGDRTISFECPACGIIKSINAAELSWDGGYDATRHFGSIDCSECYAGDSFIEEEHIYIDGSEYCAICNYTRTD